MLLCQKPSKIVIKEAKPYLVAVTYGLKQYKVKVICQQIHQKMSLQTGQKLYLDTVMELCIKDPPKLH